jgi:pantothenate synthetase
VATVRRAVEAEPLLALEYVEIVGTEDLAPWRGQRDALLAVAARAGSARLIDNVILEAAPVAAASGAHREGG